MAVTGDERGLVAARLRDQPDQVVVADHDAEPEREQIDARLGAVEDHVDQHARSG